MDSRWSLPPNVLIGGGNDNTKEGIHMRITPTNSMKQAERMAFLFALSQVALALGLFWALKAHLV